MAESFGKLVRCWEAANAGLHPEVSGRVGLEVRGQLGTCISKTVSGEADVASLGITV